MNNEAIPPPLANRITPRYQLSVPVELDQGVGVTRDLGTSGVYFTCEKGFTPGSQISFTIVLDAMNAEKPLRMRCSGKVVRIETNGEAVGVAAKIDEYVIQV